VECNAGRAFAPARQDGCRDEPGRAAAIPGQLQWDGSRQAPSAWDAWDAARRAAVLAGPHLLPEPADAGVGRSAAPVRDVRVPGVRSRQERRLAPLVRPGAAALYTPDAVRSAARSCAAGVPLALLPRAAQRDSAEQLALPAEGAQPLALQPEAARLRPGPVRPHAAVQRPADLLPAAGLDLAEQASPLRAPQPQAWLELPAQPAAEGLASPAEQPQVWPRLADACPPAAWAQDEPPLLSVAVWL